MTSAVDLLANSTAPGADIGAQRAGRTRSLLRSKKIVVGLVIIGFFVLIAIVGPALAPYDPSALSNAVLQGPSLHHLLGTTESGQDVLSQLLVGTRVSLEVGFVSAVAATVLAVLVGVTAGFVGGLGEDLLSALANIFLVIPALPLVVVLAGYLPQKGSLSVALVISLTGWAWGARVLHAQTLSVRKRDYVEAARAIGEKRSRIILVEVLPNQVAIIAACFLFTFIFAILTQASLAFLGLTNLGQWSWGTVLYWAQNDAALNLGAWWWFLPAGLCIALLGTGLALVNFGIDEFINPRLRASADGRQETPVPAAATADPAPGPVAVSASQAPVVLEMRGISVDYGNGPGAVHAVSDVSLTLHRGEFLGIAGESGSGKSTLAYAIIRLLRPPGRVTAGQVRYHRAGTGEVADILTLPREDLRALRWQEISMVFQGAMNALNPVLDVASQLTDVLTTHRPAMTASERDDRIAEMLHLVGISTDRLRSYPHQLSGGMRQRVMIAMALLLDPEIIVMDEPTTALDVVMERSILEQIAELRTRLGFSVIFITHDLSLLTEMADTIAVMYAGRVVESGPVRAIYRDPRHPYSMGLLHSFPSLRGERAVLSGIPGSPPDLRHVPEGCPFQPRCPAATAQCASLLPPLAPPDRPGGSHPGWLVACWHQNAGTGPGRPASTFRLVPSSVKGADQ